MSLSKPAPKLSISLGYFFKISYNFAKLPGHMLLLRLRDRLLQILSPKAPNLRAARETLGQIFHLLLKFYSNTNWLESGNTKIYKNLGIHMHF